MRFFCRLLLSFIFLGGSALVAADGFITPLRRGLPPITDGPLHYFLPSGAPNFSAPFDFLIEIAGQNFRVSDGVQMIRAAAGQPGTYGGGSIWVETPEGSTISPADLGTSLADWHFRFSLLRFFYQSPEAFSQSIFRDLDHAFLHETTRNSQMYLPAAQSAAGTILQRIPRAVAPSSLQCHELASRVGKDLELESD